MEKENKKYGAYVQILKEELITAMGCTEPIALAYAAARCREILGKLPEKVIAEVSGSIIKNVKSVVVPNTGGMKGIKTAVAAGLVGAKKALDASDKNARARRMNRRAQETFENAKKELLAARDEAGKALENLGQAKVDILHGSVTRFVDTFGKIHHVELADSVGMDELSEFEVNEDTLKEMGELGSLAAKMASGTVEGLAAGGLMAFGAYSAAGLLGTAGTGAAIAGLSGAAATNATLALLGGGTLAAGGLGIAGGTAVLGGLVAGPAIAVMGFMMDETGRRRLQGHRKTGGYVQRSDFPGRHAFQVAH